MKTKILAALVSAALLMSYQPATAADKGDASTELQTLVTKIKTKLREGKRTEKDLAGELKEFDTLLAEHQGEKTDDVAQILLMKATLYSEVLGDAKKGAELMDQLKHDFPDSKQVAMLKRQDEANKIKASLVEGAKFPEFNEMDLAGKPLSVANYKGKVVMIDFWATWCPPCRAELPNVLKTYQKYHDKGFEIIGVSLDSDKAKLESFLKDNKMTWPQYFDGKGWENKLAQTYGVNSIPATYLLDGEGKIIAKDLRGEELEAAVAKAVDKN